MEQENCFIFICLYILQVSCQNTKKIIYFQTEPFMQAKSKKTSTHHRKPTRKRIAKNCIISHHTTLSIMQYYALFGTSHLSTNKKGIVNDAFLMYLSAFFERKQG
ncbi:MAG: hypothetical protein IJO94_06205, partial [Firmicutes bacterium]|nr:hypothetical protein [Bacillota bacterium]